MTLTKSKHLQLVGLLHLAAIHMAKLKDIEQACLGITKENTDCGHTSDAIWSGYTADELMERLKIKVQPSKDTPT